MADNYWALEDDPDSLSSEVEERVQLFQRRMRSSRYWYTALRSWRYYHGLYFDEAVDYNDMAIRRLGAEGEQVGLGVNHLRNLIGHLQNIATQTRPDFKTRARTTDQRSLKAAEIGDSVLEYYMRDKKLEDKISRALEDSLVLMRGFLLAVWDPSLGEVVDFDPSTGMAYHEGDFSFSNPTIFDVTFDFGVESFDQAQWVCVKTWENKWDLAQTVEDDDLREKILRFDTSTSSQSLFYTGLQAEDAMTDQVAVWNFWHVETPAVTAGRFLRFLEPGLVIHGPDVNPYGTRLPLFYVEPGRTLLTPFGYSPVNDLQGLQEMYNSEMSSIATNHATFGTQYVWADEDAEVDEDMLQRGIALIRSSGLKPPAQGINLTSTPAEIFKFRDMLAQDMELVSGVNSVVRGQPSANMRSGEALKVMDARAVQFASPLIRSYYTLIERVGTHVLHTLRETMGEDEERVIRLVGEDERPYVKSFSRGDLDAIDRVVVDAGSAMSKTLSGRMALAKELLAAGFVKTPEEYYTVLRTGQLKPLMKADKAQIDLVHEENERLAKGQTARALVTDNHLLHAREHTTLLGSTEMRENSEFASQILAHVMEHLTMFQYDGVQRIQVALGYQIPFPPSAPGLPQNGGPPKEGQVETMAPRVPEGEEPAMEVETEEGAMKPGYERYPQEPRPGV